jgi:aldose 1-epimerase
VSAEAGVLLRVPYADAASGCSPSGQSLGTPARRQAPWEGVGTPPWEGVVLRTMHDTAIEECRVQGEPGLRLVAGALSATFLPDVGLTGVSLRYRDAEFLAVPGGVAALRSGRTGGLPLLAPWANRLSGRHYRAGGVDVDLTGLRLNTDENGLPIHGLLVGRPGWRISTRRTRRAAATLEASIDVDAPAFPFPHRVDVAITARDGQLDVVTTVTPTSRRRVPVAFGWHPYLRLTGMPRSRWILTMPARHHLELDDRGIPTGGATAEQAEADPVGRRHFDDLYALGRPRRLSFAADTTSVELRCGAGYDYAQVWVPPRHQFAALEPMAASTNALVDGSAPLVGPGGDYTARFSLRVDA